MEMIQNYYGSLCTEMYEILHQEAPQDELAFYLSYARKGMKILEPLCGTGRFLIPFLERGYDIQGIDLSTEMLEKLKEKSPDAKVIHQDILEYTSSEKFDYIFISSGSVSLFTDLDLGKKVLSKMKALLKKNGKFVFAVDTIASRCPEDEDYKTLVSAQTREGYRLVLKMKNHFDEQSHTQFSPSIYKLYDGTTLLQEEKMDFQTHLYEFGELEPYLHEIGFTQVNVYSSFDQKRAENNEAEMFLFECSGME